MPFFSIIIAAYNSESQIGLLLDSITKQTFKDFEVICVNDGSTDSTLDVITSYAEKDDRIKITSQENSGPGAARNAGLVHVKGKYTLIFDSDDTIKPDFLELFKQAACDNPDLICCGYTMHHSDNSINCFNSEKDIICAEHDEFLNVMPELMNKHLMYVVWNKAYKSSIINNNLIRFTDYKSCEDRIFNMAFFRYVETFRFINKPLYDYYLWDTSSLTGKFLSNRIESLETFYDALLSLYDNKPGKHNRIFANIYLKGIFAAAVTALQKDCPLSKKGKKEYISRAITAENTISAANAAYGWQMIPFKLAVNLNSIFLTKLIARLIIFTNKNLKSLFIKIKHGK